MDGLSNHRPCSCPPLRVSAILPRDHSQGDMEVPGFSLSPRVIYEVFGTHSSNWVHDTPFSCSCFLSLVTSLCLLPLVKTSCFSGTISPHTCTLTLSLPQTNPNKHYLFIYPEFCCLEKVRLKRCWEPICFSEKLHQHHWVLLQKCKISCSPTC